MLVKSRTPLVAAEKPAVVVPVAGEIGHGPAIGSADSPAYWDEACTYLAGCDRVMRKIIPNCGDDRPTAPGDAFSMLARSIVCHQIIDKSARARWRRFMALLDESTSALDPAAVLSLDAAALKRVGLSKRKIDHLRDLADHFVAGSVQVDRWQQMDDEAIVEDLLAIRGVCRWTAEMFLIFNLMRPNVLPLDDPGLRNGISLNYFSGEPVSRAEAREVGNAWAPYRSVATWYIWRSSNPLPLD